MTLDQNGLNRNGLIFQPARTSKLLIYLWAFDRFLATKFDTMFPP